MAVVYQSFTALQSRGSAYVRCHIRSSSRGEQQLELGLSEKTEVYGEDRQQLLTSSSNSQMTDARQLNAEPAGSVPVAAAEIETFINDETMYANTINRAFGRDDSSSSWSEARSGYKT